MLSGYTYSWLVNLFIACLFPGSFMKENPKACWTSLTSSKQKYHKTQTSNILLTTRSGKTHDPVSFPLSIVIYKCTWLLSWASPPRTIRPAWLIRALRDWLVLVRSWENMGKPSVHCIHTKSNGMSYEKYCFSLPQRHCEGAASLPSKSLVPL